MTNQTYEIQFDSNTNDDQTHSIKQSTMISIQLD